MSMFKNLKAKRKKSLNVIMASFLFGAYSGCSKLSVQDQAVPSIQTQENADVVSAQKQTELAVSTEAVSTSALSITRSPYGIPAKLIFMQARKTQRTCTANQVLDLKQEFSSLRKLRDISAMVPTNFSINEPVATITSTLEAQRNSLPGLRSVVSQLWYSTIYEGYRGIDGELSEEMLKLLDLPFGASAGTIYLDNPLRTQLNYFKSTGYRPVITDLVRQKLALLDSYDALLTQLVSQQAQIFQAIANKVDEYANCKIQSVYPRIEMNLAALPLNDNDLLVEKYAPQGAYANSSSLMVNEIDYRAKFPFILSRGLYTSQSGFLSSDLFSTSLTNRAFNQNGIKSELMNASNLVKGQFQTFMSMNSGKSFPNLSYHPVNYDPMGQDLMTSLLGQMLSPNAGNAAIWSSIQRLGINYSVNVYKQRLQAACGFSCPVLNQYSILSNAIDMVAMLSGDPLEAGTNYDSVLAQFKMRVVNQNILTRVLSEARAQSMFYFATRILVSRKWMDAKWFQYARSSGMVQESWNGTLVSYVGIMDMNSVLYQMLYSDGPVAHALEAQANPVVKSYFDHLMNGLVGLNFSAGDENLVFAEVGKKLDLLQKTVDESNQVFADGYLVD